MTRRNGRFLLITNNDLMLAHGSSAILPVRAFDSNHCYSAKAVYIDLTLPDDALQAAASLCLENHVPYFLWQPPKDLGRDSEAERNVLALLNSQLELSHGRTMLPTTFDKIKLQTLIDIITATNSLLQPVEVMESVMNAIDKLIEVEAWSVLMFDKEDPMMLCFAAAAGPGKDKLRNLRVPLGQGIAGWVAQHGEPVIVNEAYKDPRFLHKIDEDTHFDTRTILCAPLVSRGRTLGVLEMLNRKTEHGFSEEDLEVVQLLVNPAAVAIENAYLFQKTKTLTIQDDLTKLYNSRYLNKCIETELERAKRHGNPLSLMFLDLDGFKAINDTYGHLQGSQSLIDIAQYIRETTRSIDIIGRYGGDEFVVIMPQTGVEGSVALGERIRERICTYQLGDLRLSASVGIACYPEHGDTKEALVRLSDKAMYWVKEHGKNGVETAARFLEDE